MINLELNTKCKIEYASEFKKQLKKIIKQGKDINKRQTYRDCMEILLVFKKHL